MKLAKFFTVLLMSLLLSNFGKATLLGEELGTIMKKEVVITQYDKDNGFIITAKNGKFFFEKKGLEKKDNDTKFIDKTLSLAIDKKYPLRIRYIIKNGRKIIISFMVLLPR